jgi:hypothetical protein
MRAIYAETITSPEIAFNFSADRFPTLTLIDCDPTWRFTDHSCRMLKRPLEIPTDCP